MKKHLSEVLEVTDLGEVSHLLGNLIVINAGAVRVSRPVKLKELLADYGMENPRKVLTPMDPSFVITQQGVVDGEKGGWQATGGKEYVQ